MMIILSLLQTEVAEKGSTFHSAAMNRGNATTGRREAAQPKRDRYSAQRSDKPFEVRPRPAPRAPPPPPGPALSSTVAETDSWRAGRDERPPPSPLAGGSGL